MEIKVGNKRIGVWLDMWILSLSVRSIYKKYNNETDYFLPLMNG